MLKTPCVLRLFATAALTAALVLITVVAPTRIHAQELRGLVFEPDGITPASGVVVVLIHATKSDSIVARGATNALGRFTLKTPPRTPAVLRLLRIGFEPMDGGAVTLDADQIFNASYTLHEKRVKLATIEVKSSARCQVQPAGAELVAQLFQQARTALISSTVTLSGSITSNAISYTRHTDRRNTLIRPVQRSRLVGTRVGSYESIGVDSLDKVGYVVTDNDNFTFFAPDADVLLSDRFLTQHCLQLISGKDSLAGFVGIEFRPVTNRRNYVDVEGTLWLDRATAKLQFLEYRYTNTRDPLKGAPLGGRVEYAQIPSGGWFVSKWYIRMPLLTSERQVASSLLSLLLPPDRAVVSGFRIAGGEVRDIRMDDQVLYMNTAATTAGALATDEEYTTTGVADDNDLLLRGDSRTVKDICGTQVTADHEGLISGLISNEARQPMNNALVRAQWQEQFRIANKSIQWQNREVSSTVSTDGSYYLCGIAVRRTIAVAAKLGERWGRASFVKITKDSPVALLDITLEPPALKQK